MQANPRFGGERMGRRKQDSGGGAVDEPNRLEPGHRPGADERRGHVNALLAEGGVLIDLIHAHDAQRRLRTRRPERGQELEQGGRVDVQIAMRELEPRRGVGLPGRGDGARRAFQRMACVNEKLLAGPRHPGPTRQPLEQLDADFPLEVADLLRERWLRDPETIGRPEEAAFFGDRDEVSQVP